MSDDDGGRTTLIGLLQDEIKKLRLAIDSAEENLAAAESLLAQLIKKHNKTWLNGE